MGEGRDLFYLTCFACEEICKTAADGGLTSHVVGVLWEKEEICMWPHP